MSITKLIKFTRSGIKFTTEARLMLMTLPSSRSSIRTLESSQLASDSSLLSGSSALCSWRVSSWRMSLTQSSKLFRARIFSWPTLWCSWYASLCPFSWRPRMSAKRCATPRTTACALKSESTETPICHSSRKRSTLASASNCTPSCPSIT